MQIFIPKEVEPGETRVPMIPDNAKRLSKLGAELVIEKGLGATLGYSDQNYESIGALINDDRTTALKRADMVLRLRKPPVGEVKFLKPGAIHVSYLDPFNEPDLIKQMAKAGTSSISMEMIPRTTIAQKMDALSSQANLAGYVAVILATEHLNKLLPMMMTPAGTLKPSKVFIIGAGVAGLQAIATAKRLGAKVQAFDTRPVVEEQVKSLGAKFVKVDLGDTGQTKDGYAKQLTDEQLQLQREAMAQVCAQSDVVITTAQLFGRKAPLIVTEEMIQAMSPGSVVVDLAVESGGNVAGSKLGEIVKTDNGVSLIGYGNLPGRVPIHASQMYSANLVNFVEHFWDKESNAFQLPLEDEIVKGCLITHEGALFNETIQNR